ncbi:UDP-N-acetylmuramoyl-tripeptide--D-alanyl-D-alanine ligase [Psychromonas antarctica]|uniref:UDP-N-acetylmuramoyl-tripeptide--D-alanyl-D- alanine ligase n=1 Tax=Psychromonas antarctica TaxID=67573 RepID=UPI001EE8335D|nr:UDP-N-acetylmuramoyl-tripeptide--D-alanyl-D-alanine ligase [Psychromonas antarctica]MCG6200358.1 UDP-N-acetylmuramoyl-tripeptide--D-alanyl-D-alanine ligase [Psychromonas antarctica]
MIPLSINEIAQATNGKLSNSAYAERVIDTVSTDTRTIETGCLFIALRGASFDAHQFLNQAETAGAAALLVERRVESELPYIVVKDTRIALGLLAAYVRQKISALKCAAITGSNGKTSTKELLSEILRQFCNEKEGVLATAGNFNNDIGLPLTLLRLTEQSRFAVVELGANHAGEIAYTSQLAKPDVALINNVTAAHLEGFKSLPGVAKAKGEIWSSLTAQGCAVVNLDANFADQYLQQLKLQKCKIMTFSQTDKNATLFASDIKLNALGKATFTLNLQVDDLLKTTSIQLNLAGKHNVSNALAAASMAVALGCGLDVISSGLSLVTEVAGRVKATQINKLITVIDDTYNANSASVKAAIDLLVQYSGAHLLILGDMAELGPYSAQEHIAIGQYAAQQGIKKLFTVGRLSSLTAQSFKQSGAKGSVHFINKQALNGHLQKILLQNSEKLTILVKGSRGTKMEKIVAYISSTH